MFDHLSTEKPYPLDITDFKETGVELNKAITQAVKDTQRVLVHALPDRLQMTQTQYNILSGNPEMQPMVNEFGENTQEFYLYQTPMNVMEVEVK